MLTKVKAEAGDGQYYVFVIGKNGPMPCEDATGVVGGGPQGCRAYGILRQRPTDQLLTVSPPMAVFGGKAKRHGFPNPYVFGGSYYSDTEYINMYTPFVVWTCTNTKHNARKLDLIGKKDLRRRMVRAVIHQGMTKAEAARVFGVSRRSVHSWIDLYNEWSTSTTAAPAHHNQSLHLDNLSHSRWVTGFCPRAVAPAGVRTIKPNAAASSRASA